jgi:hypothetical protein
MPQAEMLAQLELGQALMDPAGGQAGELHANQDHQPRGGAGDDWTVGGISRADLIRTNAPRRGPAASSPGG